MRRPDNIVWSHSIQHAASGRSEMITDRTANISTHTLQTSKECGCKDDVNCNICDGGLNYCTVCHGGEIELEEETCAERLARRVEVTEQEPDDEKT